MLTAEYLEMKAASCQTHLHTTLRAWNRLQGIINDGEIELDGTKLDIPGVVAVAQ
jgi:phenylalanine ammonia-lyase